jgi:ABC-2 type transport system permease protein
MRKIWVIAVREYLATVRTKAFVMGVLMMPILLGLSIGATYAFKRMEDKTDRKFAVVDRSDGEKVFSILETALERRNTEDVVDKRTGERTGPTFSIEKVPPADWSDPKKVDEQRMALSQRVQKGELTGFLEVGPEAFKPTNWLNKLVSGALAPPEKQDDKVDLARDPKAMRYQTTITKTGAQSFYQLALMELALASMVGEKANDPEVRKMMQNARPAIALLGLSTKNDQGAIVDDEGAKKGIVNFFVAYGCILMMYALILMTSMPMMQGVLEEKMQKISEVLLGSVTPFQLMAGKLLGGVGTALTLSAIYLSGGLFALHFNGMADQLPPDLIGWFVFYLVLALLMYGSVFLAIGAACTDMKEPQTLATPVMVVLMLPMLAMVPILKEPDALFARIASFFAPTTPMLMIARQALSANIMWWEPLLGAVVVVAFAAVCVWAAGRIFRVGLLLQGKGAKFGEMLSWVFKNQ